MPKGLRQLHFQPTGDWSQRTGTMDPEWPRTTRLNRTLVPTRGRQTGQLPMLGTHMKTVAITIDAGMLASVAPLAGPHSHTATRTKILRAAAGEHPAHIAPPAEQERERAVLRRHRAPLS